MTGHSVAIILLLFASVGSFADDPAGLALADLAAYRAAIDGKPAGPAVAATWKQLWDRPEEFRNRRVRVEGRVARRFQQAAYGTFPPLVEAWAVTHAGDPFCLVYPVPKSEDLKSSDAGVGAMLRFEGVFLKNVEYQGGDTKRLAPLIVGDGNPVVVSKAEAPASSARDETWKIDWALGLGAAGLVALALARQHLRAPSRTSIGKNLDFDPPPEFVDSA